KDFIRLEGTKITYSIDTTSGCEPLRIKVSSQAMGNAEIKWDMRDGNVIDSSVFSYEYARAGIYIPISFIKQLDGCHNSLALSDTVEVVKAPAPSFDASPVCLGDSTRFINTSIEYGDNVRYLWQINGNASQQKDPVYLLPSEGDYPITLSATNDQG